MSSVCVIDIFTARVYMEGLGVCVCVYMCVCVYEEKD